AKITTVRPVRLISSPPGYASNRWTNAAMNSDPNSVPIVNGRESLASYRLVTSTPKPTATINMPVRLAGRRVQPTSPAQTNDRLTNSTSAVVRPGFWSWLLVNVSATEIAAATSAAGPK